MVGPDGSCVSRSVDVVLWVWNRGGGCIYGIVVFREAVLVLRGIKLNLDIQVFHSAFRSLKPDTHTPTSCSAPPEDTRGMENGTRLRS